MNTCKTCIHWERWVYDDKINKIPIDFDTTAGSCDLLGDNCDLNKNNDIRAYDDSLPLTTEENFGCIHHKEKE